MPLQASSQDNDAKNNSKKKNKSKKRPLTATTTTTIDMEERIRLDEEQRHLHASRDMLQQRVAAVQGDLDSAVLQQGQLRAQMEHLGQQLTQQIANRTKQAALQLDLCKSLSKTREAYLKVVMEAMDSGTLAWHHGLACLVDETVKEIVTMDRMHAADPNNLSGCNHRCQALQNTCLDLVTYFPRQRIGERQRLKDIPNQMEEHGIPPELDPLPEPELPDTSIFQNESEATMTTKRSGRAIRAWWLGEDGQVTMDDAVALSAQTVMEAMGVRVVVVDTVESKLLLERASSETESVAVNVARFVGGYSLARHAGVISASSPLDLDYLLKALQDLSFTPAVVQRVRHEFQGATTPRDNGNASLFSSREAFHCQLELLRATFALEEKGVKSTFDMETPVDDKCMDTVIETWESLQKTLSSIRCPKERRNKTLSTVIPVCRAILRALDSAADSVWYGNGQDLIHAHDKINQSLWSLLSVAFDDTLIPMLLVPLFAANIALACNLKMYHRAQSHLEALLNYSGEQLDETTGMNVMMLSELLWSQMLQLRMCFPPKDDSTEQHEENRAYLNDTIEGFGVKPRHVTPVVGKIK